MYRDYIIYEIYTFIEILYYKVTFVVTTFLYPT